MATMPPNYFSRFDPEKEYDEHLFIAGNALQSAELNEIQKQAADRLRGVADVLFKDGDIIRDAVVVVDGLTGIVTCGSGAVYLRGSVRGVPPGIVTVPLTGSYAVGIRITDTVVSVIEDPDLREPATGPRNYQEPGASRLKAHTTWAWSGDGILTGDFYPVYTVTDGILLPKEPPPNINSVTQALAIYDRDSAGGSYIVSGLRVSMLPDYGPNQVYSVAEGRARVFGFGVEYKTAVRSNLAALPDLKGISNEPFASTTLGSQRVNLQRGPATNISSVTIQTEKTVTLTHTANNSQDQLPDTSILQIVEVKQGATTYTPTVDYKLTAGKVDWSPAGIEPATGSTYTVKYQYIALVTPTLVDDYGFTVTGALVGTLILTTYAQKVPRIDRLCMDAKGNLVWLIGVASDYRPQLPATPAELLPLVSVYQTWTTARRVVNDGVRVVPMPVLARHEARLDLAMQLIAQQRLESDIHTRETGTMKGLFTEPFINDDVRDPGTAQNGAIVRGELLLPIDATINQLSPGVATPQTCQFVQVPVLEQLLRAGSMKINPYQAFAPVPPVVVLDPAVDRWTDNVSVWASPETGRFVVGSGDQSSTQQIVRTAVLNVALTEIENLRVIDVKFSITGMGPNEVLSQVNFDGVPVIAVTA